MNDVLQPKLYSLIKEREKLDKSLSEYFKLKSHILQIQNEKLTQMKVMVDIGSNFYVQTKIEDTSKIIVSLDYKGIYIEMTQDEALEFIDKKENIIRKKAETKSSHINQIRAYIIITLEAISKVLS
ncbi:prefoldin, alpha subunit [Pneumocystis carinii B80]|uniref:Prefoldin, alpha subunit n=1 Tax=Pneumocystis carinii (strain B80) TaxID=1408658 RepID=A0A0W4ZFL2_PNEC8|nr:prefoldin, alpha subunit [Pneumocystis carinii B80]KTW27114.1 prefoldin, alpha subunit [Pneumocystis carinii B80]